MDFGKRFAVGAMKSVIQKVNSEGNTNYKTNAKTEMIKKRFNKNAFCCMRHGNVKNQQGFLDWRMK